MCDVKYKKLVPRSIEHRGMLNTEQRLEMNVWIQDGWIDGWQDRMDNGG